MAKYKANRNRYYSQNYYSDGNNSPLRWSTTYYPSAKKAESGAMRKQLEIVKQGKFPLGFDIDKCHSKKYKRIK